MIICKRPDPPDDHLQEAGSSGWSFERDWILQMIICERPDPPDDHLQEAGSSRWSFTSGRMIICKKLDPLDDHLQEAGSSGWSFARWLFERGQILWMIICKRPDDYFFHRRVIQIIIFHSKCVQQIVFLHQCCILYPLRIIPWLWKFVLHLIWALYYVYIVFEVTMNMAK